MFSVSEIHLNPDAFRVSVKENYHHPDAFKVSINEIYLIPDAFRLSVKEIYLNPDAFLFSVKGIHLNPDAFRLSVKEIYGECLELARQEAESGGEEGQRKVAAYDGEEFKAKQEVYNYLRKPEASRHLT